MIPHTRFGKVCDFIGFGALVTAASALGSLVMLDVAEPLAFSTIFAATATAVAAFGVARLVQIRQVLADYEDPRRLRNPLPAAARVAAITTADTNEQATDLQRAA